MNDPHVEVLRFRLVCDNTPDLFENASGLKSHLDGFDVEVAGGVLVARPTAHHANADTARAAIRPALRGWELSAFLRDRVRVRFVFDGADVVDRDPTPGVVEGSAHFTVHADLSVGSGTVRRPNYPQPVPEMRSSSLVEDLARRLEAYEDGKEPVATMAYWVFTVLEEAFGGRDQIATRLNVAENVVDSFKRLSGSSDSRKAGANQQALTSAEEEFLARGAFRLAARVAEAEADPSNLSQITLSDLPKVP